MYPLSRPSIPSFRIAAAALLLLVFRPGATATAQDTLTSPVFKAYRPPRPGAIVEQSDVTYQLWHTFDLTRRAGAGDVPAQQELAVRYLTGRGVKADTTRGAFWTISAAAQNMPAARFNLGILYSNGWGVEWNPFAAYDQFLWCAQRGMPESQYILGTFLMENLVVPRDPAGTLRWLGAAADSGYQPARELLESLHRRGGLPAQDPGRTGAVVPADSVRHTPSSTTLPWSPVFLDFTADTGASVDEGMLIADLMRESSPEDLRRLGLGDSSRRLEDAGPEVLQAVTRSAEAGSPEALTLLGRCRERGIGIERDPVMAAVYYVRAVRLDSPRAPELLMALLDDPARMTLLRSRASSGDPAASFVLASLVGLRLTHPLLKSSTWVTDEEATKLLKRSAAEGYLPAMLELGVWFYSGRFVPQDRERALVLWEEAVLQGSREAEVRLTIARLEDGFRVSEEEIGVFSRAAVSGSILAQMALGYCSEKGLGIRQSSAAAARLYRTAAQRGSQDAYRALLRIHDAIRPEGNQFKIQED